MHDLCERRDEGWPCRSRSADPRAVEFPVSGLPDTGWVSAAALINRSRSAISLGPHAQTADEKCQHCAARSENLLKRWVAAVVTRALRT